MASQVHILTKARAVTLADHGGRLVWVGGPDDIEVAEFSAARMPELAKTHDLCVTGAVRAVDGGGLEIE